MRSIITIAVIIGLTSCGVDECVVCRYPTGEVQELCSSQVSHAGMQLNIYEDTMTNNGWTCSRKAE